MRAQDASPWATPQGEKASLAWPDMHSYSLSMTLILATRNTHKVQEIQAILGPHFRVRQMDEFGNPPMLIEDASTFAGNATCKAVQLANWLSNSPTAQGVWVLADDSGLEVDALNGEPGIHSARFAAPDKSANSPDAANNEKLLRLLADVPLAKRTARFRCALALTHVPSPAAKGASPTCLAS